MCCLAGITKTMRRRVSTQLGLRGVGIHNTANRQSHRSFHLLQQPATPQTCDETIWRSAHQLPTMLVVSSASLASRSGWQICSAGHKSCVQRGGQLIAPVDTVTSTAVDACWKVWLYLRWSHKISPAVCLSSANKPVVTNKKDNGNTCWLLQGERHWQRP